MARFSQHVMLLSFVTLLNLGFLHACTTFAAGRLATKHGSTIVTQNVDLANVDSRAVFIPPSGPHAPGTVTPVYAPEISYPRFVGVRSSTYKEPNMKVTPRGVERTPLGPTKPWPPILDYIAQVNNTYGYWEGSYGFLNEHGLALAEYTVPAILGPLPGIPQTGKMSSVSVSRFVMERCQTARCAVELAGSLFDKYGLRGEDPGNIGAGESLSFADGRETWVFHVTGGMNFNKPSIWAAQRVPDDHVALGGQAFIIRGINFDDQDHNDFYWSSNILSTITSDSRVLQKKPDCSDDPKGFDFQVCYGEDWRTLDLSGIRMSFAPSPQYITLRLWYGQNWLAPSLNLQFSLDARVYNFSVKPDKLLDRRDLMYIMGNHLEESPFDMRYGLAAGPHGDPGRALGGKGAEDARAGNPARPFALKRTAQSVVVETHQDWPTKGIMWFAADSPDTSVYAPFFAGTETKGPFAVSGHQAFNWDSAYSVFNFLNNYASLWWDTVTEQAIYPMRDEVQSSLIETCDRLLARAAAGEHVDWNMEQLQMQEFVHARWRNLTNFILTTYTDHMIYHWVNGTFAADYNGYPAWWLKLIGDNYDYRPVWAEQVKQAPAYVPLPAWLAGRASMLSASTSAMSHGVSSGVAVCVAIAVSWLLGVVTVLFAQRIVARPGGNGVKSKPLLD